MKLIPPTSHRLDRAQLGWRILDHYRREPFARISHVTTDRHRPLEPCSRRANSRLECWGRRESAAAQDDLARDAEIKAVSSSSAERTKAHTYILARASAAGASNNGKGMPSARKVCWDIRCNPLGLGLLTESTSNTHRRAWLFDPYTQRRDWEIDSLLQDTKAKVTRLPVRSAISLLSSTIYLIAGKIDLRLPTWNSAERASSPKWVA